MDLWRRRLLAVGLLWLRVLAGLGLASHGHAKIFGGRMDGFIQGVAQLGFPLPAAFAWAAALSEFAGGLLLLLGLACRPAAAAAAATMFVAAFVRHASDPFQAKELALAYLTAAGALLLTGPGPLSLDALAERLFRRSSARPS